MNDRCCPKPVRSGIFLILLLCGATQSHSDILYPEPKQLHPLPGDEALSCGELDQQITSLLDLTYSNRPGFYRDPVNGFAFWVGSLHYWPVYTLAGYSVLMGHREQKRAYTAQQRIELLRRLKAKRHCFEY